MGRYKILSLCCVAVGLAACSQAETPAQTAEAPATAQVAITSDPVKAQTVHAYTRAFNERDVEAMLSLATDDVKWISLDRTDLLLGADGPENLRTTMQEYFDSCSSCRATLRWTKTTDARVVALEEASWDAEGERKSQSALSVYEFEGEKIARVYYFPAE